MRREGPRYRAIRDIAGNNANGLDLVLPLFCCLYVHLPDIYPTVRAESVAFSRGRFVESVAPSASKVGG